MTLDEQIAILESNAEYERTHGSLQGCLEFCQLAEWLKDYQSLMQRWIPVTERLPEKDGKYLTTTMYHEVYLDYWNGECFDRTEMVVAWMRLPEPWKGEEE